MKQLLIASLPIAVLSMLSPSPANAAVEAINHAVPATMNTSGTALSPAEYIIGAPELPPPASTNVSHSATIVGGSATYNYLKILNGWTLTTAGNGTIGRDASASNNQVVVDGLDSLWVIEGSRHYVGVNGNHNSLLLTNGGTISYTNAAFQFHVGQAASSTYNSVTVSNGSILNMGAVNQGRNIGTAGSNNTLIIENGGRYLQSSGQLSIGASADANDNSFIVRGASTRATLTTLGTLGVRVGLSTNSGNNISVLDGGLFELTTPTGLTVNSGNFLRIDDGYFAFQGNQVSLFETLIGGGKVQTLAGSSWSTNTSVDDFQITYYTAGQGDLALASTGYTGLGGYTVLSYAIPEPGAVALLAMTAIGVFVLRRRTAVD